MQAAELWLRLGDMSQVMHRLIPRNGGYAKARYILGGQGAYSWSHWRTQGLIQDKRKPHSRLAQLRLSHGDGIRDVCRG
jgi:hypothetical protein